MDNPELRVRIREIIDELAPIRRPDMTGETLLVVDLGYDSLQLVELAVALEDHFALSDADFDDATQVETVADVEERIMALWAAPAGGRS
jgi:acyl carrier protein